MSEPQSLSGAEPIERAGALTGFAKAALDAAEQELIHANRIGRTQWLIAFGVLLACARTYLAALEAWSEALGE